MDQKLNFYEQRTIEWNEKSNSVVMIDQTLLPRELKFVECQTVSQVIDAIKTMKIRGAPAIGIAGAMGVALSVQSSNAKTKTQLLREIEPGTIALKSARPTAVNLAWGVEKTFDYIRSNLPENFDDVQQVKKSVVDYVGKLADADVAANKKLSDLGAKLFRTANSVLTHCN